MGIDYTLLASILIYAIVVRAFSAGKLNVLWSSIFVVFGPFLLTTIIRYILFTTYHTPLSQILTLGSAVLVVIQLLVAVFVFSQIQDEEDSISSYFGWSAAGLVLLFFVVPFAVHNIFHL